MLKKTLLVMAALLMASCTTQAQRTTDTSNTSAQAPKLTETYWLLTDLMGTPVKRTANEAHIVLHSQGNKLAGSGGCNRIAGG